MCWDGHGLAALTAFLEGGAWPSRGTGSRTKSHRERTEVHQESGEFPYKEADP